MRDAVLTFEDIHVQFGGIAALKGVTFQVEEGEICGLIGPNGAGKTTIFNCLSRLSPCHKGAIFYNGVSILDTPRHRIVQLGIGRTFQNAAMFGTLSVLQNIMLGAHAAARTGYIENLLRLPAVAKEERRHRLAAETLISMLELDAYANEPASQLPFPFQKRVELARALASSPRLLLLDEPAAGLNNDELARLSELIRRIRQEFKLTILLVEHRMSLVMGLCDRIVVLHLGRKLAEGSPEAVQRNPEVINAYLGGGA
jgi:branched-chain amino acid transport system ATP-binding protein